MAVGGSSRTRQAFDASGEGSFDAGTLRSSARQPTDGAGRSPHRRGDRSASGYRTVCAAVRQFDDHRRAQQWRRAAGSIRRPGISSTRLLHRIRATTPRRTAAWRVVSALITPAISISWHRLEARRCRFNQRGSSRNSAGPRIGRRAAVRVCGRRAAAFPGHWTTGVDRRHRRPAWGCGLGPVSMVPARRRVSAESRDAMEHAVPANRSCCTARLVRLRVRTRASRAAALLLIAVLAVSGIVGRDDTVGERCHEA